MSPNHTPKLVDARKLLDELFHPDCRPSLRWLRDQQKRRTLPFYKISRRVFFDLDACREVLEKRQQVRAFGNIR